MRVPEEGRLLRSKFVNDTFALFDATWGKGKTRQERRQMRRELVAAKPRRY